MKTGFILPVLLLGAVALTGCNVNKNISVPEHAHWSGDNNTVNGEITVGAGAIVEGSMRTINGDISLAAGAQTGHLTTVNGDIRLAENAKSDGLTAVNGNLTLGKDATIQNDVATVNGSILTAPGAHIGGDAAVVNGNIALCNSQVAGNLKFVNGTVLLAENSAVQGGITAKKPTDNGEQDKPPPVVVIGPHARVGGTITFERPGVLFVSDSATIHAVVGTSVLTFSGSAPANVPLPKCLDGG